MQESDGRTYLVHRMWVMGGPLPAATPSDDDDPLHEFVLFVDCLVGHSPVSDMAKANT